jgi:predicted PurR-regulated permease PerM
MKNPQERSNLRGTSGHSARTLPSLIALATLVLIIASLYWAQAVLIPVALAILLTFLLSPLAAALERMALGRLPSVILVVVLTFTLLGGIGWIVTLQLGSLANELPKYTGNIRQKIADVRGAGKGGALEKVQKTVEEVTSEIHKGDELTKANGQRRPVIVQPVDSSAFWPVPAAVGPMVERFASAGFVIALVIFMLIQREDLRNRLIRLVGYGRLTFTTRALEEAGQRISRYLLMQTIINSIFGLAVGLVLYLIDMPYAALWGFFAAVLRFIPYVGPFAAAIMPSALSLAAFEGWPWPILVVGIFTLRRERGRFRSGTSRRSGFLDVALGSHRTGPRHPAHGLCRRVWQICTPNGFSRSAYERSAGDGIKRKLLSETVSYGPSRGGGNRGRSS